MIKVLFNGFRHGHINGLYKKVLASNDAEIAGCIEENTAAREKAAVTLGASFSEKSYDEWLASDIDAVAIGNAYGDRGQAIIKALKAGKHVIADKPICTSLEELSEIAELSQKNNLKIACMLDLRYLPQTKKAKEILDSKRLGEIRNVSFNGQHCIDYANRPSWYFEEGMHGGTINDLSIHGVDLVRMLTGLEFAHVDAARVWNSYAYKNNDFKDCALIMARLENGAGVLADISYSVPSQVFSMPTYWEFRIWCERGMLCFNYIENKVTVFEEGVSDPIVIVPEESTYDYLDEFLLELKDGRKMTENILKSTQTVLRMQQIADREEKA